jgi:TatD DNase family protein
MLARYIDIHSHLNDKRFDPDMMEVLSRMRVASVASIVVGTDKEMSRRAIGLAEKHDDLSATIGQHPTDKHNEVFDEEWYREQAKHPKVVAIGECGLDYYWPTNPNSQKDFGDVDQEKKRQRVLFAKQIDLAEEVKKPLMIHGRPTPKTMDAYEDILEMLKGREVVGDIHFFVGTTDIAKRFLDLGFSMSFTGVITFTHDYDEVVRYIPADRIMSETDAPYVAPLPHRGKRNEPALVVETVRALARIRNSPEEELGDRLIENAVRVFSL